MFVSACDTDMKIFQEVSFYDLIQNWQRKPAESKLSISPECFLIARKINSNCDLASCTSCAALVMDLLSRAPRQL